MAARLRGAGGRTCLCVRLWRVRRRHELDAGEWRIYADVGLPVYTNASGDQLMAAAIFKLNVSYHF